ncbi:hypothetical protein EHS13_22110 [Paenibacillus psychroresistens]|uniref:Mannosylglycerate hydrolase MGH1-like glycoside hydrolase domain-containing protein n=1 Tax=Paenibacillus psychroresistens TaxID=1778678 RepID=A0A6B8RNM5_9BACL|nr:trehalase family glycosidase [Paenibacillus psychroresistens]QGQ97384.1 hypothetical protein EHS13_22110 [Paenibacillus psychroresistens]
MLLDLRTMVLSRPNTWLEVISKLDSHNNRSIYIRTMQSDANPREIFQIIPLDSNGNAKPFVDEATTSLVGLNMEDGRVEILIDEDGNMRIRGVAAGFQLFRQEPDDRGYKADYPFAIGKSRIQVNAYRSRKQYMISILQGKSLIVAPWEAVTCPTIALSFLPDESSGISEIVIEPFDTSWKERVYETGFQTCYAEAEAAFEQWLQDCPLEDGGYPSIRELAAYVQYASMVPPSGLLTRKTMLISPGFNGVWSWDHCFNAMALASSRSDMAWDQLMIPFDHQDDFGAIPDYVKNGEIVWNYTKPPIHGWTLRKMLEKTDAITITQLELFYPKLTAWTEWWFNYRDYDGNGIPQYNHGNDSGWDNSTVFGRAGAVECPDLSAFLVIQLDVLAELAARIGRVEEALAWQQRSDKLLQLMLDYFWNGEKFIAKRSGTDEVIDTDSLLHWIPVILGSKLPKDILQRIVDELGPNGPFLTKWGLATEKPSSPHYRPDGYWRGPIWSPVMFIVADGLMNAGEQELADEIALQFMRLCESGGLAENYDALNGVGQRDRFHTWPASVFQLFATDFMKEKGPVEK